MKLLSLLVLLFISLIPQAKSFELDVKAFEHLAIQSGGRLKPFDSYARESVQLITGATFYQGKNPTELVLAWLFFPDQWATKEFFQIKHFELKKILGVEKTKDYLSPQEVTQNPKLQELFKELNIKQREKKKLDGLFTAVNRLGNQINAYQEIISGQGIKLVPQRISQDWLALAELKDEAKEKFSFVSVGYFTGIAKGRGDIFSDAVENFRQFVRAQAPQVYPAEEELHLEWLYNKWHPFRAAYVIYLIALFFFIISWRKTALAVTAGGLVVHLTGFVFRCYIAGRPPVSNMYESIIWVSLGCVVFGFIFELIYKKKFTGLAATAVGALALIVGDAAPAVLDQSIRPLESVLRSNYWLTIHVLTITLSYAAFALAMGLGNIGLIYYILGQASKNKEKLNQLSLHTYKSIQIGVLLLTAGTILGGVWADASWGRFWGWDPKETWALIADLVYLALLHGRFSGWLKTFGTLAGAVVSFSAVVMAWYGVNFVLGEGLHSYGFGGGGVVYVAGVLLLQLLYVAAALLIYKRK